MTNDKIQDLFVRQKGHTIGMVTELVPSYISVQDVMSSPAISIDYCRPVAEASDLMEQLERHHLAVLKDDLIVGIVSACDLLDLVSTDRLLVEDVMSSPVVGIDYRRPVAEASDLMEQLERHHLAVLKDDLIVGIVSACDLLDLVLIDDY